MTDARGFIFVARDILGVSRKSLAAVSLLALVALSSTITTGTARARNAWLQDGKAANNQSNAVVSGNFGVLQIATNDPDELYTEWNKSTPGVSLKGATKTPRHRVITTFLVFKGCRADTSGNCNVTADFDVCDPAGQSSAQSKSAEIWVGHPPAPGNNLQLSSTGFGISFDDGDMLGAYRVRATVTDHVAGVILYTEQTLTLVGQ